MILVAGLSPAFQQLLTFDRIELGEVNRARMSRWYASGKAINVAAALAERNCEHRVVVSLGGATGARVAEDSAARGIKVEPLFVNAPTRVCTSLVEPDGKVTELVPESPRLSDGELAGFLDRYATLAKIANIAVLTGSLPIGTPADFFATLLKSTACPAIVDAQGPQLLACLSSRPAVVKPNRKELAKTVGKTLATDDDVIAACRELLDGGAQAAIVTDGARAVHAVTAEQHWTLKPEQIAVVNPIGSGDCLTGTLAWALACQKSLRESLEMAIAAASKHAATALTMP